MACENNIVNKIVGVLDSKSAEDITVLDVCGLTTLADYFVIATGKNEKQTQALADYVEEELAKDGVFHLSKEGYRSGDWILLSFEDAIVHIFKPDTRDFYNIERVWSDANEIDVTDLLS